VTGVSYADDGASLEETEGGMRAVLEEFARESRDIGNRYKAKDQKILVFGPTDKRGRTE
jgi:hypothetical protein